MPNTYFQFKQFLINQELCGMKVTTDACLFGALIADKLRGSQGNILDIGTGTGLLSLMLAQQTEGEIEAIEIDHSAYIQAEDNFRKSSWSHRVQVRHTSFQDYYHAMETSGQHQRFDHIICNPPFFSQHLAGSDKSKNSALHDENSLLPALASAVKSLLKPKGQFYLLLPAFEMSQFIENAKTHGIYQQTSINVYQKQGKSIFRTITGFGKEAISLVPESDLYIHSEGREYSEVFTRLLKPYYLQL